MNKKLVGLVATVLALSAIGFGYAYWTETLKIEGSVATGELDVEFLNIGTSGSPEMTCAAVGSDSDGDGDIDTITVTVEKGYPSGWCNVTFDIENGGTIPAKVTGISITGDTTELTTTLTGIAVNDVISMGASVSCELDVHVEESALENTTYTVTVAIAFEQFNAP